MTLMQTTKTNLAELVNLIKYPSLTEKAINLYSERQYTFIVDRSLTKTKIKYIIENIFNVTIINISTLMIPPKTKRVGKFIGKRSRYKKAFVKLKEGDTITELFN
jgi:large subunit ribosomal protein L23